MVKSGYFNAIKNNDGSFDRTYNADDINKYFKGAMSENGIYKFVGNQCKVNTYSGMSVLVKDGKGAIKYHWFEMETDEAITINDAHPTLSRYTAIVMRYDEANRYIGLATIDGEYEEIPSKPEIIRNSSVYDICLAYVYVEAGATEITIDKIQDTREDTELCGYVKSLLEVGSGDGGIPKVPVLPLAQESELGKIYYLTTAYDVYKVGFYVCEKILTYGYKTVVFTEGLISERPDAAFTYANQVYHAIDEDKYYVCKKNESEVYEWQEIIVNIETGLPSASIATLNRYYLVDGILSLGNVSTDYTWKKINFVVNATEVIIPATGWETVSDGTTNYYTIEITVEGMTSGFVGSSATDYVRPTPFNVAENDARKDLFGLITNIESMEGKIKVYASEIPSAPLAIYLYGV